MVWVIDCHGYCQSYGSITRALGKQPQRWGCNLAGTPMRYSSSGLHWDLDVLACGRGAEAGEQCVFHICSSAKLNMQISHAPEWQGQTLLQLSFLQKELCLVQVRDEDWKSPSSYRRFKKGVSAACPAKPHVCIYQASSQKVNIV